MKFNLPPFNEKVTRGYFEQSILDFSSNLFTIPILGLSLGIGINALLIYMYSQNKSCLSLFFYFILVYLIFSIILAQIINLKRNK